MIFENVFALSVLYVILFSFIVGFLTLLLVGVFLWRKNAHLSQFKGWKRILLPSLVCGLSSSFFLTIVICTLTPSLITVEDDLSYTEEFSFFSNGEFIGIGGNYIANNSNKTLRLVGIGDNNDVNVKIPSKDIAKVRICPQVFFKEVPKKQSKRVTRTRRGRLRVISGPSVYLIENKNY